jgi:hypothetical protein
MENKTQETAQEKFTVGSEVGKKVNCSMCHKEGTTDEFVTLQNNKGETVYLCSQCKVATNELFEAETKNPNIVLGLILGVVGAIVGGLVWYFVAISAEMEIGYISLGMGYLIGMGVYLGSGKKRGHTLQVISAVIALVAIFITKKYIFDFFLNQYVQENPTEFPQLVGQVISVPFFYSDFLMSLASPIGILIYVLGIYFAYNVCKPRGI